MEKFNERTGRKLRVEIEPGSFLVANAGIMIAEVMDLVSTKTSEEDPKGHNFLKLNTGLNEVTRPALYGAQHSIRFFPADITRELGLDTESYVIVGHCCESGDLITCDPGDSNEVREMPVSNDI